MKIKMLITISILALVVLAITGSCTTDPGTQETKTPVISGSAQPLQATGKIYMKDDFLFVNELNEGVHVIDNHNPYQPVIIGFLKIPGNVDTAIRDNVLYADSHTDLVVIDISDPTRVSEIRRVENIFPEPPRIPILLKILLLPLLLLASPGGEPERAEAETSSTGEGGSLARFAIVDDYLYTLHGSALQLFDIKNPANPTVWKKIEIGWDIETIFPYEDKLFIGGQEGMYIYDNKNPAKPDLISRFAHVTSCDPVVVEGNYAYVTLRGGTNCGNQFDRLEIIDISVIENPRLLADYPMSGPYGLGIDGDSLFICDGQAGLKLYDVSNPHELKLVDVFDNIYPLDVILTNERAVVVGKGGLYQFNFQSLVKLEFLSKIPAQ